MTAVLVWVEANATAPARNAPQHPATTRSADLDGLGRSFKMSVPLGESRLAQPTTPVLVVRIGRCGRQRYAQYPGTDPEVQAGHWIALGKRANRKLHALNHVLAISKRP